MNGADPLTSAGRGTTMTLMFRGLVILATLFTIIPRVAAGQTPSVLHIKVVLVDADGNTTPVPRHPLLISDNPSS